MKALIKELFERVESWPEEDQEELAEVAREIEARRQGVYQLNDDERAAIAEGLADARAGRFVSDEDMAAFFRRHGIKRQS